MSGFDDDLISWRCEMRAKDDLETLEQAYLRGVEAGKKDANRYTGELKSALAAALTELENYWYQVDGERGCTGKTLDQECADGEQPVIALVRKLVQGIKS